jgi:dolichyl-diphosphooligosaccharide--protein glycosyltransferase
LGGTTAGLFAALLFAFSPAIIERGNLGWFKSEPLGLFFGLLAAYLFISAIRHKEIKYAIPKAVVGGLVLGYANASWGGIEYFSVPISLFLVALPFFRKDIQIPMYVAIAFTVFSMISAHAFPRPGTSFILGLPGLAQMGGTLFIVIAYFIKRFSSPHNEIRNLVFLLIGFVALAIGLLAGGIYISPSFRYLNAVNPFIGSQNPLVESVAEHFTPTVADFFTNYSILLMFAGLGAWMAFKRRNDMGVFTLILSFTALYVSATFARLLVYASIGVIILAGLGLYEVTRTVLEYRDNAATAAALKAKRRIGETRAEERAALQPTGGFFTRIAYVVVVILMLTVPMFYPTNSSWVSSADVPAAIANGGTGYRLQTNDWVDAMNWIKHNTPPNAVIASWWDYGYWIQTLGNRTTLDDNATLNQTRIEKVARMLVSPEQTGVKIAQDLHADYILIYGVGRVEYVAKQNTTSGLKDVPVYSLGQGGDESKKQWFMRIGGIDEHQFIEQDGFTPTPAFWNNTLLGKLLPFEPLSYVSINSQGAIQKFDNNTYQAGDIQLYTKRIKYPETYQADQPLQLVYSSPSFSQDSGIVFGVFIYKVNPSYVPKAPVALDTLMKPSTEIATLNTTQGIIKLQFFPNAAPNTVKNFETLAKSGFYNGTIFHRIVPGFVIQGGDPNTRPNGTARDQWGQGGPPNKVNAEFNAIPHHRGIVSMARAQDPNSAGSQFFIVLKDSDFLDGQYTAFGQVIQGMDVVDKIAALPTITNGTDKDQPVDPNQARILSVTIQ